MQLRKSKILSYLSACLALVITFGVFGPVDLSHAAVKTFSSCAKLRVVYPKGIAETAAKAKLAVKAGKQSPRVSASIYKANRKLDLKKSGYMCAIADLGTVSIQTAFGYVKAPQVYRPKDGDCSELDVTIDVRNMTKLNYWGIFITIEDSFQNVVGTVFFDPAEPITETSPIAKKPNGIYKLPMSVCDYSQDFGGFLGQTTPYMHGERYYLRVEQLLQFVTLGSKSYVFH